ncbi:Gti1/Pac2 family-domain-containing protein [Mycena crocata]|nr:Gti1/Pac2 family-domain-containing protein [Mycena crocata]
MFQPEFACLTHPALHIRDITDAHRVLEAVRLKVLPRIKRRLAPHERAQLRSGMVFVWEESDDDDGLVRWTEGKRWSQSKMRGDCLFYEEKIGHTDEERQAKAARRAMKASDSCDAIPAPPKRKDRPSKVDGLIKQTYSVTVHLPGVASPRKWHIVAYLSTRDTSQLPVVEDYDYLRDIRIPDGVFFSSSRPVNGSYERFQPPLQRPRSGSSSSTQRSLSPALHIVPKIQPSPTNCAPSPWYIRDQNIVLPPIAPARPPRMLPPLSSLECLSPSHAQHKFHPTTSRMAPFHHKSICSDDRRVLDRFRVVI